MILKPLHRKELIKIMIKAGFTGPNIWWKHNYMISKSWLKVIIPNTHSWKDIPVPIIKAIIKQANIDIAYFL